MIRKPANLDFSFEILNKLISFGFESSEGPGDFPIDKRNNSVRGLIAANYHYRACTSNLAWGYKEIAESKIPEVYVILGRGDGLKTYFFGDWITPFGTIKVNKKFGYDLVHKYEKLMRDVKAFEADENIEKQLPCLQFANKNDLSKMSILPILIGDLSYVEICEFADVLSSLNIEMCVIASANLTYYGKKYGFVPFVYNVKENISSKDAELIDLICKLDTLGFLEATRKGNFLDRKVIATQIEIMKSLGCKKGRLLNYSTSGEVEGYENAVGFGSIVF